MQKLHLPARQIFSHQSCVFWVQQEYKTCEVHETGRDLQFNRKKNTWTTLDRVSSVEDCTLIKVAVPYQNRQKMVGRSFAKVFGQVLLAVDLKQAWLKCLATEIDMQTFTRRHCCPFQDAVVITIKAAGLFITLQWVFWEKLRAVVDY